MTDTAARETAQEKIAKLLAKAEGTDNEHEAETYRNKALDLMAKWGIEEAMLNAGRTRADREKVTEDPMRFVGGYAKAMSLFAAIIAKGMGTVRVYESYQSGRANVRRLHIVGHKSDVTRAHMLITSLQLQADAALRTWWRTFDAKAYLSPSEKRNARRQFLVSFAESAATRLTEAREQAAREQHAAHSAPAAQAGPSVALVLADRRDEVDAYMAREHPRLSNGRPMQGSVFGEAEGAAAGRRADLGTRDTVNGGARAAIA